MRDRNKNLYGKPTEGIGSFETAFVYINILNQFARAMKMPYKTLRDQHNVTLRYEQIAPYQN